MAHMRSTLSVLGAAALLRLVVLVALDRRRNCSSRSTGWVADEGEFLSRLLQGKLASGSGLAVALAAMGHVALVARLGVGGCAYDGLDGDHSCHLLTQLAQPIAQGGYVISGSDGLGA
eukprot:3331156-Pleurochrysis_carterae.AAC.2